jgi:hypothetical protein
MQHEKQGKGPKKVFEAQSYYFYKNNKKFELESTEHPGIFLAKKKDIWKPLEKTASSKQRQATISALKRVQGYVGFCDKFIKSLHKNVDEQRI